MLFFIQCQYGISLNVDIPNKSTSDNLNKVGNVVNCSFVIDVYRFLLHIYSLIVVIFHFLQDKI